MNEWNVLYVVGVAIIFGISIGAPLLKLNSNITRMNVILEVFQKQVENDKKTNAEEHTALWDKSEKHEETINDHETRLQLIEHK